MPKAKRRRQEEQRVIEELSPIRTFDSEFCCEHRWNTDKVKLDGTMVCSKCFAECKRDKTGKIVEYDLHVLDREREKKEAPSCGA